MTEREFNFDTFVKALTEAKLDEIIDSERLEDFHIFVRNRGIPSKGYVVSMPLTDGRLWAAFRIENVEASIFTLKPRLDLHLKPPRMYIGKDPKDRTLPEEIKELPVWWLDEQMEGQIATED